MSKNVPHHTLMSEEQFLDIISGLAIRYSGIETPEIKTKDDYTSIYYHLNLPKNEVLSLAEELKITVAFFCNNLDRPHFGFGFPCIFIYDNDTNKVLSWSNTFCGIWTA